MRQEKTLKICANHLVSPQVELQSNVGSDRSWVFTSSDFADEELKTETFAIKFGNSENANKFKDALEEAKAINAGGEGGAAAATEDGEEEEDIDAAIEKRNVAAAKRRDSLRLISAQADPDHDSDEEDVDEGAAERLAQTVGDHTANAAKETEETGIKLAQGMAQMKVACGGFGEKSCSDPDVQAAAEFALTALKTKGCAVDSLVKVAEASSQVVAGLNFKLTLHVAHEGGEVNAYSVKVFRPLPHTGNPMELSQYEHLGVV